MPKEIKPGKFKVLSRWYLDAPLNFVASEPMSNHSVQIWEVIRVIYLHEFSWLNALWLDAEIYTVDIRLSELFYIKFSSLDHE